MATLDIPPAEAKADDFASDSSVKPPPLVGPFKGSPHVYDFPPPDRGAPGGTGKGGGGTIEIQFPHTDPLPEPILARFKGRDRRTRGRSRITNKQRELDQSLQGVRSPVVHAAANADSHTHYTFRSVVQRVHLAPPHVAFRHICFCVCV